jgi:hypothetical protein
MLIFSYKYTTMPRLSLYRPEKGNDFRMLDRVINEQFQVGGTDVFIHKYIGPQDPDAETTTSACLKASSCLEATTRASSQ